ncbi:RNA polymerase sigma-70 factor [Sphingobacterium griseoflavum]|uniref:DNA-directed RNA polymerase sigma-70 factor n=1 Tax=Sphingobacterium griseoflavum TaxID=1474952 RepID=A0ABQ3HWR0_9SPHI|nr:RNA polymerase sigma-70 factor [Sphingobacterium griseoflavum]GHE28613.1 DNA-directed RNA polymerase sigma-70 factor [Sphingobacterium griseoflavum]
MSLKKLTDKQLMMVFPEEQGELVMQEIYNRYWKKLLGVAYNHLGNKQDAEDVVQDVLLSLWKRRNSLQVAVLENYLAIAVKYRVFHYLKNRRNDVFQSDSDGLLERHTASDEHEKIYANFIEQQIRGVVAHLPEKCKLVFVLSRQEGKTIPAIAQTLNVAEKTVEGHLTKALKAIRLYLKATNSAVLLFIILLL